MSVRLVLSICFACLVRIAPVHAQAQMTASAPELIAKNLVAIGGGRHLNMVCMGSGSPTLVFDTGLGGNILNWQKVQVPVSKITRACFYDRAGYGYSDPSPSPMTADNIANDLHALLQNAGISGPVVLVGLSIGGLYATLYTDKFGLQVAGLILIDPSFADDLKVGYSVAQLRRGEEGTKKGRAQTRACANLARAGKLTAADPHDCFAFAKGRTPTEIAYLTAVYTKPFWYEALLNEGLSVYSFTEKSDEDSREEKTAAASFGDKPVIVLTPGNTPPDPDATAEDMKLRTTYWKSGHDKLAARSTRGESIIVPSSGHFIQVDQPGAVIDAIRKVVLEVRQSTPK
jgi:pimeloyl-ACP methyl ester carboxylesterase